MQKPVSNGLIQWFGSKSRSLTKSYYLNLDLLAVLPAEVSILKEGRDTQMILEVEEGFVFVYFMVKSVSVQIYSILAAFQRKLWT